MRVTHGFTLQALSSLLHWQHLVSGLEDGFTIKLNHQLSSLLPFFRLHMLFIFFLNTKKGLSLLQIENAKLEWERR